jgi:hypothetical protein
MPSKRHWSNNVYEYIEGYWSCCIASRTTLRPLTQIDSPDEKIKQEAFDKATREGPLGPRMEGSENDDLELLTPMYEPYEDNNSGDTEPPVVDDEDDFDTEALDNYLQAEVVLAVGGENLSGKVIARKRDADGNPIGKANMNPILDTRVYDVEFPDGNVDKYAANIIAESMVAQVDDEGIQYLLMDEITDHLCDGTAVSIANQYVTHNGRQFIWKTTCGWKMCIKWKDGSTS